MTHDKRYLFSAATLYARVLWMLGFCVTVLFPSCATYSAAQEAALTGIHTTEAGFSEGSGRGRLGPITVRIRIDGQTVTGIEIVESSEDPFVGGAAMEELLELVLLYNSTDIDAVSGATESSKGFLSAVENAILNYE